MTQRVLVTTILDVESNADPAHVAEDARREVRFLLNRNLGESTIGSNGTIVNVYALTVSPEIAPAIGNPSAGTPSVVFPGGVEVKHNSSCPCKAAGCPVDARRDPCWTEGCSLSFDQGPYRPETCVTCGKVYTTFICESHAVQS